MKTDKSYHQDKGLSGILKLPWAYNLFVTIISKKKSSIALVNNFIRPFPGCKILEIGCGTGGILSHLPNNIGEYEGFDMNPLYINYAKKRWHNNSNCNFFCQKVTSRGLGKTNFFDIVLALGVIHHLNDEEAWHLFSIANNSLKQNGVLITYDNVFIKKQNKFARWLISKDRGNAVRTVDEYIKLAKNHFPTTNSSLIHNALRVPYTNFVMRCIKC